MADTAAPPPADDAFFALPNEIICRVVRHLRRRDRHSLSATCRRLFDVCCLPRSCHYIDECAPYGPRAADGWVSRCRRCPTEAYRIGIVIADTAAVASAAYIPPRAQWLRLGVQKMPIRSATLLDAAVSAALAAAPTIHMAAIETRDTAIREVIDFAGDGGKFDVLCVMSQWTNPFFSRKWLYAFLRSSATGTHARDMVFVTPSDGSTGGHRWSYGGAVHRHRGTVLSLDYNRIASAALVTSRTRVCLLLDKCRALFSSTRLKRIETVVLHAKTFAFKDAATSACIGAPFAGVTTVRIVADTCDPVQPLLLAKVVAFWVIAFPQLAAIEFEPRAQAAANALAAHYSDMPVRRVPVDMRLRSHFSFEHHSMSPLARLMRAKPRHSALVQSEQHVTWPPPSHRYDSKSH